MRAPLLEVRGLRIVFHTAAGSFAAVDGASLEIAAGEVLGLVGESGSGKSVTGYSIMGLIDPPGEVTDGAVLLAGRDLLRLPEPERRRLRGDRIAMVFQDPLMTLNPVLTVGTQMIEAVREHHDMRRAEALERAAAALARLGIPAARERLAAFPHELSGGMRQRVAIATALLNSPDLVIADEPTTALDVTIQGQILFEMQALVAASGTALLWITHDLGVVAGLADRIAVVYAGRIVEAGPTDAVLDRPRHPYTAGLLASIPGESAPGTRLRQIEGAAPPLHARPQGCAFAPRCARALAICRDVAPNVTAETDRLWRCHNTVPG